MCEWGTTVVLEITVPASLSRTCTERQKLVDVDACLAPIVKALNVGGVVTVACCCGHGQVPGFVSLADGRELVVVTTAEADALRSGLSKDIHGNMRTGATA